MMHAIMLLMATAVACRSLTNELKTICEEEYVYQLMNKGGDGLRSHAFMRALWHIEEECDRWSRKYRSCKKISCARYKRATPRFLLSDKGKNWATCKGICGASVVQMITNAISADVALTI